MFDRDALYCPFPVDADETRITAEHREGLLLLHLGKLDKPLPKTIEVKVT